MSDPRVGSEPTWGEIAPYVDQALAELPEDLAVPLTMHYLQGQGQSEIASELAVNQSTVSRRIERGLEELRQKLRQAGVVVSVAILGTLLGQNAAGAAPAALMSSLGKMAMSGVGSAPGPVGVSSVAAQSAASAGTLSSAGAMTLGAKVTIVASLAAVSVAGVVANRSLRGAHQPPTVPPVVGAAELPATTSGPGNRRSEAAPGTSDAELEGNAPAAIREADRVPLPPAGAALGDDQAGDQDSQSDLLREALSSDPRVQFEAVRKLAISGYTREAADVLTKVVSNPKVSETTRGYAAMGLRNFTRKLPAEQKASARKILQEALRSEGTDAPDAVVRTLLAWGGAAYIQEALGEQFRGHSMEIEVLERSPDAGASDRLWGIYTACPKGRKAAHYGKRASVGRALVNRKDVRGIDILMTLLPEDKAPGPQYRNNVYNFLALKLGIDFGYKIGNYRPELEQAVPKMISWWEQNRASFTFDPPERSRDASGPVQPPPTKSVSQQRDADAEAVSDEVWKLRALTAIRDYLSKPERQALARELEKPLASPEHYMKIHHSAKSVVVSVTGLKGGGSGIKAAFDGATGKLLTITPIAGK